MPTLARVSLDPESLPEVEPHDAVRLVGGGAFLLDVREHEEWQVGRAPDAYHLPLGELGARLHEIPTDRAVVVVCRSGARSAYAASALAAKGFEALNLTGGMQAWHAVGLEVVADGGKPGGVA